MMDVAAGPFDLQTQRKLWTLCSKGGAIERIANVGAVLLGVNNVAVTFDPFQSSADALQDSLTAAWAQAEPCMDEGRLTEIPVSYSVSGESDLAGVAEHAGLSVGDTIALHTSVEYRVACIGWVPGFAFMVGLPERLVTPRRSNPRLSVPRGSVGIGGVQTGVIPIQAPSGWNLLGRTDLNLFSPTSGRACVLAPGDRVRFVARSTQ
jgi:KipI family sensor histidine kinase inhibitor